MDRYRSTSRTGRNAREGASLLPCSNWLLACYDFAQHLRVDGGNLDISELAREPSTPLAEQGGRG